LVLVGGLALATGCSALVSFDALEGVATSDAGGEASTQDASSVDGTVASDAGSSQEDSAVEAGADATPMPCVAATTIGGFDGGLGAFAPFSLVSDYPNEESFFGDDAMVLLPFRDTSPKDAGPDADPLPGDPEIKSSHSGLFYPVPVPLAAFDVTFDAKVVCTSNSSCADGLIFAWLDLPSTAALVNNDDGSNGGLPDSTAGALFDIDNYQNGPDEQNDPYAPSLQIDVLDPTKSVGTYSWQTAIDKTTLGDWHTYGVSLRAGHVQITVDGAKSIAANVPVLAKGIVGFTAGVGGESDAVAIRKVSGTFYDCQP
jgi:hypothetical protein